MAKKVTPGAPKYANGSEVNQRARKGPTPEEINRRNAEHWELESRKFSERIVKRPHDATIAADRLDLYLATGQNTAESMVSLVAMMAESHDQKHRVTSAKGGKRAGKKKRDKAESWQSQCVEAARKQLGEGKARRELAGALAPRFGRAPQTIRKLLKKARI